MIDYIFNKIQAELKSCYNSKLYQFWLLDTDYDPHGIRKQYKADGTERRAIVNIIPMNKNKDEYSCIIMTTDSHDKTFIYHFEKDQFKLIYDENTWSEFRNNYFYSTFLLRARSEVAY